MYITYYDIEIGRFLDYLKNLGNEKMIEGAFALFNKRFDYTPGPSVDVLAGPSPSAAYECADEDFRPELYPNTRIIKNEKGYALFSEVPVEFNGFRDVVDYKEGCLYQTPEEIAAFVENIVERMTGGCYYYASPDDVAKLINFYLQYTVANEIEVDNTNYPKYSELREYFEKKAQKDKEEYESQFTGIEQATLAHFEAMGFNIRIKNNKVIFYYFMRYGTDEQVLTNRYMTVKDFKNIIMYGDVMRGNGPIYKTEEDAEKRREFDFVSEMEKVEIGYIEPIKREEMERAGFLDNITLDEFAKLGFATRDDWIRGEVVECYMVDPATQNVESPFYFEDLKGALACDFVALFKTEEEALEAVKNNDVVPFDIKKLKEE